MDTQNAAQVVEQWRAAERRLATRDPDAADFEDMMRAVERLRREYQRVAERSGAVRQQLHAASS